jgi:hypothetical protein
VRRRIDVVERDVGERLVLEPDGVPARIEGRLHVIIEAHV